jgi:hypothetical protein
MYSSNIPIVDVLLLGIVAISTYPCFFEILFL